MPALEKSSTNGHSGEMPRTVGERVLRAIRDAKGSDPFAPVYLITQLGTRRLRLEVGRRAAVVNVHWMYPDQLTALPTDGSPVIVVGPIPEDLPAGDCVHIATPDTLDLSGTCVVSCPDAAVEARIAVDALLEARQATNTPWSSMAVAVAAPSSQPMLVDALRRTGIPYFLGNGRPVSQSEAGRFVLGALAAARSNWNRGDISALWACAPVQDPATGTSVPVEQWERVSRRYKVVDRLDWELLEQRVTNGPSAAIDLPIAQQVVAFIHALQQTVDPDGRGLAEALTRFLPPSGSPMAHEVFGGRAQAEREGEASDVVRRKLAELDRLDPQPDDRYEWLANALSSSRMQGTGRVGEGVQVGRPEALALGDFKRVVVLGVSDEADSRHLEARTVLTAALALLAECPEVTFTIPRSSARSQREVSPHPEVLQALTRLGTKPVTAEDVHAYPPKVVGVQMIPSWSAAAVGDERFSALDVKDHRLAALHRWVSTGGDLTQHPLAQHDPNLLQSIAADRARRSDQWTAFDGQLDELHGWAPTEQTWSVTTMEKFHECHLRIFLKSVLGAYPSELPEEQADPEGRSNGSFVHKVMELLTQDLLDIRPAQRPTWQHYLQHLDPGYLPEVMDRAVDDLRADGTVGHGHWWDAQVRWLRARLQHYLANEARHADGFEPLAVEHGPTSNNTWPLHTAVGDVPMQGRADRIEARGDVLRVVDFKSGQLKKLRKVTGSDDQLDEGRTLQLPIYAAMAAEHFHYDVDRVKGAYINPLSADGAKRKLEVEAGSLTTQALELLKRSFEDMAAGEFTSAIATDPQVSEDMCRFCDMVTCCPTDRMEQGRIKLAAAATTEAQVAP